MLVRVPLAAMLLVSLGLLGLGRLAETDARHPPAIAHARATRLAAAAQHDALIRELERACAEVKRKIEVLPTAPTAADDDSVERALAQRHALLVQRAHMELVVPVTPASP